MKILNKKVMQDLVLLDQKLTEMAACTSFSYEDVRSLVLALSKECLIAAMAGGIDPKSVVDLIRVNELNKG